MTGYGQDTFSKGLSHNARTSSRRFVVVVSPIRAIGERHNGYWYALLALIATCGPLLVVQLDLNSLNPKRHTHLTND